MPIVPIVMKISKKLALLTAVITVIGSIVKVIVDIEPSAMSASPPATVTATNGSLLISGQGNQINGVYIQHIHNANDTTPYVTKQGPTAQATAYSLVGKWHGRSWYDVPGAELTSSGYSEFLASGDYNFSGEFVLRNVAPLEPGTAMVSKVVAAGRWRAEGGKYTITLVDMHTVGTVIRRPGQADIDLDQTALAVGALPVRLDKAIPKGASQEFALLELGAKSMRSTGQDLPGHRVDYAAIRVQ